MAIDPALARMGMAAFRAGDRSAALDYFRRAGAFSDAGNVLMAEGRTTEAIAEYRRAIAADPAAPQPLNNLANALQISGLLDESVAAYRQALALAPDYAEAHRNLGSALRRLGRSVEAAACFQRAVELNPAFAEAIMQLVLEKKSACDWDGLDQLTRQLAGLVETGQATVNPFLFLTLDTSPRQQLACARHWAEVHLPVARSAHPVVQRRGGRITLGYLSADFQEHATAHLTAELFRAHDRTRFRVIGYSYGADDGGAMRRRLVATFDEFSDLEHASHAEAAARIRADGVDILIDLKGYTRDARPEIAALRPAPVQVSYLGYPGTMGTRAMDYLIADRFVIPEEEQAYYAEKIAYLPDCYQVNDPGRRIAERVPTRAECGLPEKGFVFCCFNTASKLTPEMFALWMRLLDAVPGSVLWLLSGGPAMEANLRAIVGERVIFAPSLPNPEHLARLGLADLFLDTLPYNAHTLASDALWAGLPVITCAGQSFAGRVAGSLLRTAGLPELVTGSLAEYGSLAVALARDPERLAEIRNRIRAARTESPLFDCERWTRNLEALFEAMITGPGKSAPLKVTVPGTVGERE